LNTGAKSPAESTRFATSVGENGTSAILGFDHGLLQLSSYAEGSLRLVQEYIPDERPQQLLSRTQTEIEKTRFGWGLSLRQLQRKEVKRGFIDCRWPTQRVQADPIFTKVTTYVKDGRLIQVVAIASKSPSGGSVVWALGGKIQLVQRFFRKPTTNTFGRYWVRTSRDGYVLSVGCDQVPYCLDIELFINRLPLKHPRGQTQDSRGQRSDFADISCHGRLKLLGTSAEILVAMFSLRDRNLNLEPKELPCPDWAEIQSFIWLDRKPRNRTPLTNFLEERAGTDQLSEIPTIITRNVEQLLSVAALPDFTQRAPAPPVGSLIGDHPHPSPEMTGSPSHRNGSGHVTPRTTAAPQPDYRQTKLRKVYLINSLVGDDSLEINYEACL
jgi:hypothetical protein